MNANMQAHRRKKKKRPVFSYMRNIRSVFLQADDLGKFGFTLSGQQPCILSSIVKNSPADLASVKSGDFLISVNGKSVWHMTHEEIVELIGTSEYRIRITIADNYISDSSDEEDVSQFRYRPKYPYSKSRTNRTQASTSSFDSPHSRIPPRFHTHPPLPYVQHNISSLRNEYDVSVGAVLKTASSSSTVAVTAAVAAAAGASSSIMIANTTVSIIVGYLGTIEIPKQIATSSKLQTVRSCIRKMRQEKRSPTLVLMNILPNALNLLNSNNVILATYPASRLNYISSSSDNNSKFFGLVTSARQSHEDDVPFDSYDSLKMRQVEVAITNSCHVFGIETKLIDHNAHVATAEKFKIKCTKDLISSSCLEFPTTSDYICNIIRSMYNIKSPDKSDAGMSASAGMKFNQIQRRNNQFNDPHELLLPNSPHPSNHSEITTSSNSDSGIGFHNDLTNISDRILVVDFPDQNRCALGIHNKNLNLQRLRKSRPLGIVNDFQLQENAIRNIRTMHQHQPSSSSSASPRVENVFHAKSKSADYNYENVEKLAIRAMPLRSVSNLQQELSNDYENIHPKAVTDVWYDGEMLDEDGNEIHERAIDVSLEKQQLSSEQVQQKNIMIRSCDDILMIMDKEESELQESGEGSRSADQDPPAKKDDHVFLVPSARPQKRYNNKRSLTLLGKSKSSHEDSKSKHESNLKHYKLSPKVFGLARPVSISFENLSTATTTAMTSTTTSKRRSLFGSSSGSKKKESKHVDEEEFTIWGSLQELRNCENLKQEKQTNFLEGTYSEPNLSYDESKQSQSDLSSFKRWGQSSLRARDDRVRPSSLTASESDVYTKLTDPNKDSRFALGPSSWGQSFEFLLNDPNGLKVFAEFLKKEFSGENIYFWTACERYRQLVDDDEERRKEAIAIYEKHLGNGAHEPVNVDSNARNCTRDGLSKAELDLFTSAQKQIFNLMKFDSYQRFIRSDLYKNCIQAEQKNTLLPYASENLDPLLKITRSPCNQAAAAATAAASANSVASKLKKSLSNAEDRRRKSLLPWHRKTRCKSKDREEENKKNSTSSSNTLKHHSNHSGGDLHSSRSSLSSFDAAIAKISSFDDETRNSLCRVILRENGATTIVQIKHDETIRELVERVLDKRGFSYQAYEVFLSGTNKALDLDTVSKELAGNEVFIEQRVVFKLDLPNRKVISVKSKPSKLLCEVLRPILHKYNYRLDMVHAYSKETNDLIDTSLQVTDVDGMRLLILFKDDCAAAASNSNNNNNNNNNTINSSSGNGSGNVTEIGQKHVLHNFNMRNAPVTFVRANKLVSSISNPQLNTLDEITNKVFNEVLQCKSTAESETSNGANRNCDQGSIKSEDWGSETETSSGIFNRIRRHKKPLKSTAAAVAVAVSKSSAGSEREESDANALKKPLIAKWKVGNQKLQVTSRNQNDESLLENLKRAQCLRIEDQRGTDINFELPDFLKDRNKFSGQKLRKTVTTAAPEEVSSNLYSNIDSLSPNRSDFNKMNVSPSQQKPPQPLPRTSLNNKSPLKSSPEISSVQSKISSLENAILMSSSRSNTPINMNVSTTCMPSTTPIIKNRHSDEFYSENYGDTTMIFNHNHRDYHLHHHQNGGGGGEFQQRLSQNQKDSPPKLPPKRNFYKMSDVPTNQPEIYLDQPSSSFV